MGSRSQRRAALLLRGVDGAERLAGARALAARAGVPVTLAIDSETAVGIARTRPQLAEELRAAFAAGELAAMLTTAHAADAALLTAEELADELRLNEETLQLLFGVALDRRGFAGAVADVAALEQAGIDFVIGDADEPCRLGERLMALPIACVDSLEAAEAALGALVDGGTEIVAAPAWAAGLTPPWLPAAALPAREPVPAALQALAQLGQWCVSAFGLRRVPGLSAAALVEEAWKLERFPARARVPLVRRRGLVASRRAWVAAYEWCDVLAVEARVPGLAAHATEALPPTVLPQLCAIAGEHGAGEPMARAEAAYEELRSFGFLGGQRWRALLSALRDAFALLAARRTVDWTIEAEAAPAVDEQPILRLVESSAPLN
ncbi:MAG: hypothetical protein ACXVCV_19245 [Polyangia bacterium]